MLEGVNESSRFPGGVPETLYPFRDLYTQTGRSSVAKVSLPNEAGYVRDSRESSLLPDSLLRRYSFEYLLFLFLKMYFEMKNLL